jgi:hypothetical protein
METLLQDLRYGTQNPLPWTVDLAPVRCAFFRRIS